MPDSHDFGVRRATVVDAPAAAQLLHDFNREFTEPTPPVAALARRLRELIEGGDTIVLLGGARPRRGRRAPASPGDLE
jgi:hypothetical protein